MLSILQRLKDAFRNTRGIVTAEEQKIVALEHELHDAVVAKLVELEQRLGILEAPADKGR